MPDEKQNAGRSIPIHAARTVPPNKARGALSFVPGRFEPEERERYDDGWGGEAHLLSTCPAASIETTVTEERARSIISRNKSPDVPFELSINPYRGCEHGCIYCFARPSHAYLELSPGLDFETRLFAKTNAVELLRRELSRPGHKVSPIALGVNTDAYQPVESQYRLTRSLIEVLAECEHPFTLITKSALVERDIDLLAPLAEKNLCSVFITITTLDHALARRLEPRAASPRRRLETVRILAAAGIPTGVMMAPIIPALNDKSIEEVVEEAAAAGATSAGYVMLRLPNELKELFREWLAAHYPERAEHVMSILRQMRGGRDNDPRFGRRMTGTGNYAELIAKRFEIALRRYGLETRSTALSTAALAGRPLGLDCTKFRPQAAAARKPQSPQLALF